MPGSAFYAHAADPRTLRLSFVTLSPADIAEGVVVLGRIVREQMAESAQPAP